MSLTYDKLVTITQEAVRGDKPSVQGAEADAFRKALEPDLKLAKQKGWVIDIPPD